MEIDLKIQKKDFTRKIFGVFQGGVLRVGL